MIRNLIAILALTFVTMVHTANMASAARVVDQKAAQAEPAKLTEADAQKATKTPTIIDPKIQAQNQFKIRKLVNQFRKSYEDADKLTEIIKQLAALGERGKKVALQEIDRALKTLLQAYQKAFAAHAVQMTRAKYLENRKSITAMRRQVMATLHQNHEFDQEDVKKVLAAVADINKVTFVTKKEVRQSSKRLLAAAIAIDALVNSQHIFLRKSTVGHGQGQYSVSDLINNIESKGVYEARYGRRDNNINAKNSTPATGKSNNTVSASALEIAATKALNSFRNSLGLSSLMIDSNLIAAGRDHSKDMSNLNFFSHTSPIARKTNPWDRARLFGTTASAENIAKGFTDPQRVTDAWIKSPGHRKNMVGAYSRVGVGFYHVGGHWTQLFGR